MIKIDIILINIIIIFLIWYFLFIGQILPNNATMRLSLFVLLFIYFFTQTIEHISKIYTTAYIYTYIFAKKHPFRISTSGSNKI